MNTQNWEEEFDKNFQELLTATYDKNVDDVIARDVKNEVKSFISRERVTAYEQGAKDSYTKWYEQGLKEGRGDFESGIKQAREEGYEQGRKDGAELATAIKDGCCDQKINIAKAELVREIIEAVEGMKKEDLSRYPECTWSSALTDTLSTLRTLAEKHNIKP